MLDSIDQVWGTIGGGGAKVSRGKIAFFSCGSPYTQKTHFMQAGNTAIELYGTPPSVPYFLKTCGRNFA